MPEPAAAPETPPPPAQRHTVELLVRLSTRTFDALGEAAFISDADPNDTVNAAIRAYAYLVGRVERGAKVIIREAGCPDEIVRFLA